MKFDRVHGSRQNQDGFSLLQGLAEQYGIVIGAVPTKEFLLGLVKQKPIDKKNPNPKTIDEKEKEKQERAAKEAKDDEQKDILLPNEKHLFWRFQLQKIDPERLIVDNRGAKDYRSERPEPLELPPVTTEQLFNQANNIFGQRDLTDAALDANRWMEKFGRRDADQKDEKLDETKEEIEAILKVAEMNRGDTLRFRGRNLPVSLAQDQFQQFVERLREPPQVEEEQERPRKQRRVDVRRSGRDRGTGNRRFDQFAA
jgi:hypothetical protein